MTKSKGLSRLDKAMKRGLDVFGASVGLVSGAGLIAASYLVARIDTGKSGFFTQERVGKDGKPFRTIKIRTMKDIAGVSTNVTTGGDPRITRVGRILRRSKLDELPQLINVLLGDMSLVGPRPDVPGFADKLEGADRIILSIRPGITGPASLKFRDEEKLLAEQSDPEDFNRRVIYPEKVRLNREYVENYRFRDDLLYILATVLGWELEELRDSSPPE
jgi:lipopolysaccharide/colanic/teichoic acid biosynthesis glycosyltransferase